jgi:hypothetical protein
MPDAVWLNYSALGSGYNDCGTCGATVPWKNQKQHENFHKTFSNLREDNMSNVTWCDPGNHAFKTGTPGAIHFEGTQVNAEGKSESVSTDACPEHNPYAESSVKDNAQRLRLTAEAEQELNNG